jgi:HEAT repeat protein
VFGAEQLGALADRALVPAMLALFDEARRRAFSSKPYLRIGTALARALGATGDPRTVGPLGRALREGPFPSIQAAAADALAQICSDETWAAPAAARNAEDGLVRRAVRMGLRRCTR